MFLAQYDDCFCSGDTLEQVYTLIIYKMGSHIDIDDIYFYEHISVKIETKTIVTKNEGY